MKYTNWQQYRDSLEIVLPSPLQALKLAESQWHNPNNCGVFVKRDDAIHPIISGNKWRKLTAQLRYVLDNNISHVISFGGMYSNHLHSLSYCLNQMGVTFTAIVRGHQEAPSTPMLEDIRNWHTKVIFVDRVTYQQRTAEDYLAQLTTSYPDAYIIPEGGSHSLALNGVAEIVKELQALSPDYILCPVASGGTLAGLVNTNTKASCIGIGVLKGKGYLESEVSALLHTGDIQREPASCWRILHDYHHGGYAKRNLELIEFCQQFELIQGITVEPTYSGKLMYAVRDLLANGYFTPNSTVVVLHTGGLQGAR